MGTKLENPPQEPETILRLIKDAIARCRDSSSQLCGFARGLEIGIWTLQEPEATADDSLNRLRERSLRLSSRDDYHLGVAIGINLTIDLVSTTYSAARAPV